MKFANKLMAHRDVAMVALVACCIFTMSQIAEAQGFDDSRYKTICADVLHLLEGPFGAMLTAGTGVGAVISSALGSFKMAWSLVIVSVGCYIAKGYITVFFPAC